MLATPAELAEVLGVGRSKAYALAKEPWLAALRGPDGWDADAVVRARTEQGREAGLEVTDADAQVLASADHPVELVKAAVRLAARRLARDPKASRSKLLDDLNKAVDNLRLTEQGFLELTIRRGELIERDVAKACMGALARRFVLACERLEVRVAAQVELWLADEKLRALSTDERGRAVRAWVAQQTKQARLGETDDAAREEIEKMIAAEVASRRKA
jgi:hypothetical protein